MKVKKVSLAVKISLLVMTISFIGISMLAYFSYKQAQDIFVEHTANILKKNIEKYESELIEAINKVSNNVELLAYSPSIQGFFRAYQDPYKYDEENNKTFDQYLTEIKTLFRLTLNQNYSYFQIRILDSKGKELVKLVREQGKIIIIPADKLQDKSQMGYFKKSFFIEEEQVYISEINLNREFNTIEFPVKPTIRVAKPIELNHKRVGIVIINANIKDLFKLERIRKNPDEITYIANKNGYYIFNQNEPFKEFGFEYGFNYKIFTDFPEVKKLFDRPDATSVSFVYPEKGEIFEAKKVFIAPDDFLVVMKKTTTKAFEKKASVYMNTLFGYILIITALITLITIFMVKRLTDPINRLTRIAREIARTKGKKVVNVDIKTNDEIEELAHSFKIMLKSLIESQRELEKFAERLEKEVEEKTKELKKLNENLQREVEKQVKELRKKDQALVQQSKLAAMGEMIGAIAHQWRQPLNYLALNIQLLDELAQDGELTPEVVDEISKKMMNTIQFMSKTIDDFRSFFRKDKEKVVFDLKEAVENTIELLKPQLENRGIDIIEKLEPVKVRGFKNEFRQVILNLITNARDAVEERIKKEGIKGKIEVELKKEGSQAVIKIKDNGGGIPEDIKSRIFEPYFTTKEEGKGTGLGLYMAKEIISRMGGELIFRNTQEGAEFIIKLQVEDEGKTQ
ncbi:sensor histidine kinase [Persephonella sp.]